MSRKVTQLVLLALMVAVVASLTILYYQLGDIHDGIKRVEAQVKKNTSLVDEIRETRSSFSREIREVARRVDDETSEGRIASAKAIGIRAYTAPYVVQVGTKRERFRDEAEALALYKQHDDASLETYRYFADTYAESGWALEFIEWHGGRLSVGMFSLRGEAREFSKLSAFEARLGSLEYLLARSVPK